MPSSATARAVVRFQAPMGGRKRSAGAADDDFEQVLASPLNTVPMGGRG